MALDITNDAIINRLKNKFEDLFLDFDDFVHILKTHKAILSGSFLLQTIKNCEYSDYDLDIYVLGDKQNFKLETLLNALYNAALSKMIIKYLDKSKKLANNQLCINSHKHKIKMPSDLGITSVVRMSNMSYGSNIYIKGISAITKSEDDNVWGNCTDLSNALSYIQIIYIDPTKYDKLENFITDSVDFDFCRNYFDGDLVFMQKPESIFMVDYNHKISSIHELYFSSSRIDKYNKRGYCIKVNYNNELYNLLIINKKYKDEFKQLNEQTVDNLIIINYNHTHSRNFISSSLPIELFDIPNSVNKCIIYGYNYNVKLTNIPSCLSILDTYIFSIGVSEKIAHTFKTKKKLYYYDFSKAINFIIHPDMKCNKTVLDTKIPFGCKIFMNDIQLN